MSLLSLVSCAILFRMPHPLRPRLPVLDLPRGRTDRRLLRLASLVPARAVPDPPARHRSGFAFNAGRVHGRRGTPASGALLNSFDEDYRPDVLHVTLVYIFGMALIWFAPETKGKPLPD